MTRRTRAVVFLLLAVACAALAAALANGYGSRVAGSFGPLRPVVVATRELAAGQVIAPADLRRSLQLRRVPARFVPPGTLAAPVQAVGRAPTADLPAGSYLLDAQLRLPRRGDREAGPHLAGDRRPVQIAVSGGEALLAAGRSPEGGAVDVVVTSEPRGAGPGRTYVAAAGVRLLALAEQDPVSPGPSGGWSATLALTRRQALRLIQAESFARSVRLLPLPAG